MKLPGFTTRVSFFQQTTHVHSLLSFWNSLSFWAKWNEAEESLSLTSHYNTKIFRLRSQSSLRSRWHNVFNEIATNFLLFLYWIPTFGRDTRLPLRMTKLPPISLREIGGSSKWDCHRFWRDPLLGCHCEENFVFCGNLQNLRNDKKIKLMWEFSFNPVLHTGN